MPFHEQLLVYPWQVRLCRCYNHYRKRPLERHFPSQSIYPAMSLQLHILPYQDSMHYNLTH